MSPFGPYVMATDQSFDHIHLQGGHALSYGIMSTGRIASAVPANYSVSSVMVLSSGVNRAMDDWGDVLLAQSGKVREAYKRDLAVRTPAGMVTRRNMVYNETQKCE